MVRRGRAAQDAKVKFGSAYCDSVVALCRVSLVFISSGADACNNHITRVDPEKPADRTLGIGHGPLG